VVSEPVPSGNTSCPGFVPQGPRNDAAYEFQIGLYAGIDSIALGSNITADQRDSGRIDLLAVRLNSVPGADTARKNDFCLTIASIHSASLEIENQPSLQPRRNLRVHCKEIRRPLGNDPQRPPTHYWPLQLREEFEQCLDSQRSKEPRGFGELLFCCRRAKKRQAGFPRYREDRIAILSATFNEVRPAMFFS
jgi:hypothetical protein